MTGVKKSQSMSWVTLLCFILLLCCHIIHLKKKNQHIHWQTLWHLVMYDLWLSRTQVQTEHWQPFWWWLKQGMLNRWILVNKGHQCQENQNKKSAIKFDKDAFRGGYPIINLFFLNPHISVIFDAVLWKMFLSFTQTLPADGHGNPKETTAYVRIYFHETCPTTQLHVTGGILYEQMKGFKDVFKSFPDHTSWKISFVSLSNCCLFKVLMAAVKYW